MSYRVHLHLQLLGLTGKEAAHLCIVLTSRQQQSLSLLQQVCGLFTDTARRLESLQQYTVFSLASNDSAGHNKVRRALAQHAACT